jgi:transglutaminase-like putative cysteine protease
VVAVAAGLALAADGGGSRPVLHEDLPAPAEHPTPMIGGGGSGNPAAFTAGDKVLPRPGLDQPDAPSNKEPVLGQGGFAADRQTEMKPDGNTGPDSTLHYVSVFNPDVLPFKRMSAMDAVTTDYTLKIGHTARTEVLVGGTTDKTRDRFWGSVLVNLKPGAEAPLPSVAPDMRILSYEIKPSIAIKFEKDGADNFYVRSDESSASGTYRLVFLADADAGYFAPSLPTDQHYTPNRLLAMTPSELRPVVPDQIRRAAERELQKLGIDGDTELGVAFNKLVAEFRAFTAKPLPKNSGDIYRDLCDSRAGVCRHRSFAFMVTANAVGIPTRFVENEAHAFVEVYFGPSRKWQRIDLGGAALRMEVSGADNKTLHRPRAEDPFSKPPEYKQSYTQLEGDIKGLTQQQIDDKKKSLDQSPPSGAFGNNGGGPSNSGLGADRLTPDPGLPAVVQDPKKQNVRLSVTTADAQAYRGDSLHVEGRVDTSGHGVPDHQVNIWISPAGRGGRDATYLGYAMTEADGSFRIDLPVLSTPGSTLNLGTYDIILMSPDDASFNAARSDE